ncbi:hypothetical protein [Deinococcus marmoris]|uniref:hypothetical protein n=1 Tax=Deinococcus marmoris TaxID=249408 RepID=UPI0012DD5A3B|nr:hypothetical protein [Deinococcus marmoris]
MTHRRIHSAEFKRDAVGVHQKAGAGGLANRFVRLFGTVTPQASSEHFSTGKPLPLDFGGLYDLTVMD